MCVHHMVAGKRLESGSRSVIKSTCKFFVALFVEVAAFISTRSSFFAASLSKKFLSS